MVFQVSVTGVDELAGRQMTTDVQIRRRLFGHSEAEIVIPWQENSGYDERDASRIAALALNCPVDVTWRDNDLGEATLLFHGYVQGATGIHRPASSSITLRGISYSARTDAVARFRAFQETNLAEIAQQIARSEPLIRIHQGNLLEAVPVPLSVQYGETDFGYLSRLCSAWNVPMAVSDLTGQVILGAASKETQQDFPDIDWGWSEVGFNAALHAPPPTSGPQVALTGLSDMARMGLGRYTAQLSPLAAHYAGHADGPALSDALGWRTAQAGTSERVLRLDGAVLGFSPGEAMIFDGQSSLISAVNIVGDPHSGMASQEFWLHSVALPLMPKSAVPQWSSRAVWAHVIDNQHDPLQQGRIQVKFAWEHLDPQKSHQKAWLHTLTPYGGGSGGTASTRYSGFYSLPEVGERVLVEFLGDWDSEAVVVGSVRDASVSPAFDPRHTKRWRTPSGNGFAMTTRDGEDWVTIDARGRTVMQAVVDKNGESVIVRCGGSAIHLHDGPSGRRVDVLSGGEMLVRAAGHLQIEGESVEIRARSSVLGLPGEQAPLLKAVKTHQVKPLKAGAAGLKTPCVLAAMKAVSKEDRKHAAVSVPAILAAAKNAGITDTRQVAYMLATAEWENNFKSAPELWDNDKDQKRYAHRNGNHNAEEGYNYRGRGYVQITGLDNYANWSKKVGVDLVKNPEYTERPEVAAQIMAEGMRDGAFRGHSVHVMSGGSRVLRHERYSLDKFIHGKVADYAGAREIINSDQGRPVGSRAPGHAKELVPHYIASRAEHYAKALDGCGTAKTTKPKQAAKGPIKKQRPRP